MGYHPFSNKPPVIIDNSSPGDSPPSPAHHSDVASENQANFEHGKLLRVILYNKYEPQSDPTNNIGVAFNFKWEKPSPNGTNQRILLTDVFFSTSWDHPFGTNRIPLKQVLKNNSSNLLLQIPKNALLTEPNWKKEDPLISSDTMKNVIRELFVQKVEERENQDNLLSKVIALIQDPDAIWGYYYMVVEQGLLTDIDKRDMAACAIGVMGISAIVIPVLMVSGVLATIATAPIWLTGVLCALLTLIGITALVGAPLYVWDKHWNTGAIFNRIWPLTRDTGPNPPLQQVFTLE